MTTSSTLYETPDAHSAGSEPEFSLLTYPPQDGRFAACPTASEFTAELNVIAIPPPYFAATHAA